MKDQKLQDEINQKVLKQSNSQLFFTELLHTTLENFFYRYFDNVEETSPGTWQSPETQMALALKTPNEKAQEGIKKLARAVAKKDGPTVMRKISCTFGPITSSGKGNLKILTAISWDHPQHTWNMDNSVAQETIFNFDDGLHFRNQLALYLEKAFSLF